MTRRNLFFAAGIGGLILVYLLDSGYRNYIETPTTRYQAEEKKLRKALDDAEFSYASGAKVADKLDAYAQRALPLDPGLARSSYRNWLLRLVEEHEMQSAAVDAETPRPIQIKSRSKKKQASVIGHRLVFTLRARTTLSKLADFLYDFQRSAQLHKINNFAISPLADGNQLDLTVAIEALSLEATDRESQLSRLVRADGSLPARNSYDAFVTRNLFAKGFSKTLGQVRLKAITKNRGGQFEAWFSIGPSAKTQILGVDSKLAIPLHDVIVQSFENGRVKLSVNRFDCWIEMGQSLADVLGVPAEPPVQTQRSAETESTQDPATDGSPSTPGTEPPAEDAPATNVTVNPVTIEHTRFHRQLASS